MCLRGHRSNSPRSSFSTVSLSEFVAEDRAWATSCFVGAMIEQVLQPGEVPGVVVLPLLWGYDIGDVDKGVVQDDQPGQMVLCGDRVRTSETVQETMPDTTGRATPGRGCCCSRGMPRSRCQAGLAPAVQRWPVPLRAFGRGWSGRCGQRLVLIW